MVRQRRAVLNTPAMPHTGSCLYSSAVAGGAQALGFAAAGLSVGAPADIVVLDTERPEFAGVTPAALLDSYVFSPRPGAVRDVMVGGKWVIRQRHHPQRAVIEAAYHACLKGLESS